MSLQSILVICEAYIVVTSVPSDEHVGLYHVSSRLVIKSSDMCV